MSYSLEDTQPRAPFNGDPLDLKPTLQPPDDEPPARGGCLTTALIIAVMLVFALAIVALAAAAGWTSGQRQANGNATSTQNAAVNDQLNHIAGDIADNNLVLLDARLRWLATQTPGVSGIDGLIMTGTAVYMNSLPTATLPASPTLEAATEAVTEQIAITQQSNGGYDLASILNQAQSAIASSQWQNAIDLLDVIIGADPTFQTQTVNGLMSKALTSYALQLYNDKQPAQANLLVDRAEGYGPLPEGMDYERYAAELYLTARAAIGTGSPTAINALQKVINLGPGRYYQDAQQLLGQAYVARGDAYMAQGDSCSAVAQYQQAGGSAGNKLAAAQNACANATPTPDPNIALSPEPGVAPVGQVGG